MVIDKTIVISSYSLLGDRKGLIKFVYVSSGEVSGRGLNKQHGLPPYPCTLPFELRFLIEILLLILTHFTFRCSPITLMKFMHKFQYVSTGTSRMRFEPTISSMVAE